MSFDTLAPHYRWMEFLLAGNKLQRCRTTFLPQVADARNVLILGEGNGRFLLACRRALPKARITCLDASARMLAIARRRLLRHGANVDGIDFVTADARSWAPPKSSFDLIVTHFFLDCFGPEDVQRLVSGLAEAAKPQAAWLLADFQAPASGLARKRAQVVHWLMYRFFRLVTRLPAKKLSQPDSFLHAQRFALVDRRVSDWGLLRTDWWTRPAPVEKAMDTPQALRQSFARK